MDCRPTALTCAPKTTILNPPIVKNWCLHLKRPNIMYHCLSLDFVTMDIIAPEGIPPGILKITRGVEDIRFRTRFLSFILFGAEPASFEPGYHRIPI